MVRELGDQIVHVHLKDGKGLFPNFAFPRSGRATSTFPPRRALRAAGYSGALSVEYEAQVYGYREERGRDPREGKAFCDRLAAAS